jgi:hypothetical protein
MQFIAEKILSKYFLILHTGILLWSNKEYGKNNTEKRDY